MGFGERNGNTLLSHVVLQSFIKYWSEW